MTNTVLRTVLLESFKDLQARFDNSLERAQDREREFDALRHRFAENMSARLHEARERLATSSPIREQVLGFIDVMDATKTEWDAKVAGRNKGVEFRAGFEDSLLVFINGKVKSGKSSLGNYMAWGNTDPDEEQKGLVPGTLVPKFFSHAQTSVEGGDAVDEAESRRELRVGATEATSSIQGFSLPGLTWVDSPGLHSLNPANGNLAREYVDHADLILYTMKSDAPGRESDIAEITQLFDKDKKVLLLLTGSDDVEEDFDEASGALVQRIVMKDRERRARQCDYVRAALERTCSAADVKNVEIVSLSARYAQLYADDDSAFHDSGMRRLCSTLHAIAQSDGVRMKQRTPMTNLRNFLNNCGADLQPYRALIGGFKKPLQALKERSGKSLNGFVLQGQAELQDFIDDAFLQMESGRDQADAVNKRLARFEKELNARYQEIATRQLGEIFEDIMTGFASAVRDTYSGSSMVQLPGFQLQTITEKIPMVQAGTRKRNSILGSIVGGIGGFFVGGPAGAAYGASLGGGLGGALGNSASTRYYDIDLTVGDNLQDIRLQAQRSSQQALDSQMRAAADQLWQSMEQEVDQLLAGLGQEIEQFDQGLQALLRAIQTNEA
ncbi:dynamin family protein [Massilia sp.]|uniref:dynamin family protein n=1 Tax=Massilia sp. TaxID=1882437 RepID=UPI002896ACBB|nr:dynamin family protein [Massilia sp.]